jgi:hypothetical protein
MQAIESQVLSRIPPVLPLTRVYPDTRLGLASKCRSSEKKFDPGANYFCALHSSPFIFLGSRA